MKRIFPVFLSLVLVFSFMLVTVSASESIFLNSDDCFEYIGLYCFPTLVPEGKYSAVLTDFSGESFIIEPFEVLYEPIVYEGLDLCFSSAVVTPFECYGTLFNRIEFGYNMVDGNYVTFARLGHYSNPNSGLSVAPSSSLELIPISSSAAPLSAVVDGDMMSGVLDQVVSLLPVVLGILVAYIAIRKGIGFLRGFLAGS